MIALRGVWIVLWICIASLGERTTAERAGCRDLHYDLVFVLDGSSNVGPENFAKARLWVSDFLGGLDTGKNKTRVGLVWFDDAPHTAFRLGSSFGREGIRKAVRNVRYQGGTGKAAPARAGAALAYVVKQSFSRARAQGSGGPQRVAVLVTGGKSRDAVANAALAARGAAVRVFVVGVGDVLKEEMETMATDPDSSHIFHVEDFGSLQRVTAVLQQKLCENVVCPSYQIEKQRGSGKNVEIPGFDLLERLALLENVAQPTESGQREEARLRLRGNPISQPTEKVFPHGLPNEYTLIAVFKVQKSSQEDNWMLWHVIDKFGITQVSLRLDGEAKTVEFSALGRRRDRVGAVFKGPTVGQLFDQRWHRLELHVEPARTSLHVDCQPGVTRATEPKEDVATDGFTLLGSSVNSDESAQVDILKLSIYCDSRYAELESCCDIPGFQCYSARQDSNSAYLMDQAEGGSRFDLQEKEANCSCPHGQPSYRHGRLQQDSADVDSDISYGDRNYQDLEGVPFPEGPFRSSSWPGYHGEGFLKGEKGDQGEAGGPGQPAPPFSKGSVRQPNVPGGRFPVTKGPPAFPDLSGAGGGLNGFPGLSGNSGQRGRRGEIGPPGNEGPRGPQGPPGFPGPPGSPGPMGFPGELGKPGIPGSSGPPGQPGLSGRPGDHGIPGIKVLPLMGTQTPFF